MSLYKDFTYYLFYYICYREWRKGTSYAQEPPPSKMNTAGIVPSSERYAAQKKLKTSHTSVPMSQKYISHGQPSSPADPASVPVNRKSCALDEFLCCAIIYSLSVE